MSSATYVSKSSVGGPRARHPPHRAPSLPTPLLLFQRATDAEIETLAKSIDLTSTQIKSWLNRNKKKSFKSKA